MPKVNYINLFRITTLFGIRLNIVYILYAIIILEITPALISNTIINSIMLLSI